MSDYVEVNMKKYRDVKEEEVCRPSLLFGVPDSTPRNSYLCPEHKLIPASEVDWHGTQPYCPHCWQRLTTHSTPVK